MTTMALTTKISTFILLTVLISSTFGIDADDSSLYEAYRACLDGKSKSMTSISSCIVEVYNSCDEQCSEQGCDSGECDEITYAQYIRECTDELSSNEEQSSCRRQADESAYATRVADIYSSDCLTLCSDTACSHTLHGGQHDVTAYSLRNYCRQECRKGPMTPLVHPCDRDKECCGYDAHNDVCDCGDNSEDQEDCLFLMQFDNCFYTNYCCIVDAGVDYDYYWDENEKEDEIKLSTEAIIGISFGALAGLILIFAFVRFTLSKKKKSESPYPVTKPHQKSQPSVTSQRQPEFDPSSYRPADIQLQNQEGAQWNQNNMQQAKVVMTDSEIQRLKDIEQRRMEPEMNNVYQPSGFQDMRTDLRQQQYAKGQF